jgi:adenosylhomocysteine nucleosidase
MGHVRRLGVVTGLQREADALRRSFGAATPPIVCSGADPGRAAAGATELASGGCDLLVSFGFAAGLQASLAAGDIVLADRVLTVEGNAYATDAAARSHLAQALDRHGWRWQGGGVAGVERVLASPADKREVARRTGAVAADMESGAIAAAAAGLPFIVLRVVADPATRAVPSSILAALAGDGRLRAGALLAGLLRRPGEIAQLAALIGDGARVGPALRRAAVVLRAAFARM